MRVRLYLFIMAIYFFAFFTVAGAAPPPQPVNPNKHVLIINSYHKGYPWTDNALAGIESVLKDGRSNIELHVEFMDSKRVVDKNYFYRLFLYYRSKFDQVKFDLIIVSDNDAFNFALRYRDALFPKIPIVFCGVNALNEMLQQKVPLLTGVIEDYDVKATLDVALKLHPNTKEIIAVNNGTPIGAVKKQLFTDALAAAGKNLKATIIDDPALADVEKLLKDKSKECVVILLGSFKERSGVTVPIEVSTPILAGYDVPLYGLFEYYLGHGIIGGKVVSSYHQGALAAQMGIKLLQGEPTDRIPIERKSPNLYIFDYNQMEKFGINQGALPEGAVIINKPKTLPEQNNTMAWEIAVILISLGIAVVLLALYIRSRRSAEELLEKLSVDHEKKIEARTEELTKSNADLRLKIAETKQKQDILKENEILLKKIIDAMPGAVMISNREGVVEYISEGFLKTFKFSREDLSSMDAWWHKAYPDKSMRDIASGEWLRAVSTRKLAEESFQPIKSKITTKDGLSLEKELRFIPIHDMVVMVITDITKKKHSEDRVPVSRNHESIETLAAGIAHDFNNLLLVILGNISLAKASLPEDDKTFERLIEAERASMMTKDLIQQLITFSKGGELSKRAVMIAPLVMEITRSALSNTNIRGKYIMSDDLLPVEIDEGQIRQAINIILRNAREAMPQGGIVAISFEVVRVSREDYLPLMDGDYVKISFQDEGLGIKTEHLERIFDPYFTTKDAGSQKGVGLGLAIAYSIIKKHSGHIAVESSVDGGTTFHIYLPVFGKEVAPGKEPVMTPVEEAKRQGKILVMDDAKSVREVTGAMLSHIGYDVEFSREGREAVALYRAAQESGQPFDAVILDLTVQGGMGGKEAIQLLIMMDPHIKAIISSGFSGDPIMSDYQEYGFKTAILKPYKMEELKEILERLIRSPELH